MTAGSALAELCEWATDILILDDSFMEKIPAGFRSKVQSLHVGIDRWSNPYHPELFALVKGMVEQKFGFKVNA